MKKINETHKPFATINKLLNNDLVSTDERRRDIEDVLKKYIDLEVKRISSIESDLTQDELNDFESVLIEGFHEVEHAVSSKVIPTEMLLMVQEYALSCVGSIAYESCRRLSAR